MLDEERIASPRPDLMAPKNNDCHHLIPAMRRPQTCSSISMGYQWQREKALSSSLFIVVIEFFKDCWFLKFHI